MKREAKLTEGTTFGSGTMRLGEGSLSAWCEDVS